MIPRTHRPRPKLSEAEQAKRAIERDHAEHPRAIARNRKEAALHLLRGKPELARILYETNAGLARAAGLEEQVAEATRDLSLLSGHCSPDLSAPVDVEVVIRRPGR